MIDERSQEQRRPQKQDDGSGLGVGLGLLICGLVCLLFPKYVGTMPTQIATILYVVGLLALLVGIIGTCMELSKRRAR